MTTFVTMPLSAFEYRANFSEPIFAHWNQNGEVLAAVFRAFRPWNITLDRVTSAPNPANFGQLQINFEVVPQRFVFGVNVGAAILSVSNPRWQEAALIREIARAGTAAMETSANAEIDSQEVTMSLHLTPQGRTVREVTEHLAPRDIPFAKSSDALAWGFSVHKANGSAVVDLSRECPESLFIRLTQTFKKGTAPEQIETEVRKGQEELLSAIGLSFQPPG